MRYLVPPLSPSLVQGEKSGIEVLKSQDKNFCMRQNKMVNCSKCQVFKQLMPFLTSNKPDLITIRGWESICKDQHRKKTEKYCRWLTAWQKRVTGGMKIFFFTG